MLKLSGLILNKQAAKLLWRKISLFSNLIWHAVTFDYYNMYQTLFVHWQMDLEDEANGKPQNFTYSLLFLLRQQVDATFASASSEAVFMKSETSLTQMMITNLSVREYWVITIWSRSDWMHTRGYSYWLPLIIQTAIIYGRDNWNCFTAGVPCAQHAAKWVKHGAWWVQLYTWMTTVRQAPEAANAGFLYLFRCFQSD